MPWCWNEHSYGEKALERTWFERNKSVWNTTWFEFETRSEVFPGLLDAPDCMGGCRHIWHTLKLQGIGASRFAVEALLRESFL